MPIYEYRCEACGHQLEKLQKMSDPALVDCPACAAPQLRKLISAAGFQLKGSGWYVTDFRGDKKKPADSKTEGSKSADSKPAEAAAPTPTPAASTKATGGAGGGD